MFNGNTYNYVYSLSSGNLLTASGFQKPTSILIKNETLNAVHSMIGGTVTISSKIPGIVNLIVLDSYFKNTRSPGGSALELKDLGKIVIDNCTFTQDENFSNPLLV
jgi:hypothetical protein